MTRSILLVGFSTLCLVAAAAAPAQANSPVGSAKTGLADLTELNLIVIGDMSAGADVEGKSWIGGNLNNAQTMGLGSSANPSQGFTPSSFVTLTVGGNVTGNLNLDNGPNGKVASGITPFGATVGGTVSNINPNGSGATLQVGGGIGLININSPQSKGETIQAGGYVNDNGHTNGASVSDNLGTKFSTPLQKGIATQTATFVSDLKSLSAALAALAPTAGAAFNGSDPNNATIKAVDTDKLGYAVIDITSTQLDDARTLSLDLAKVGSGYLTTVINVTGSSVKFTANPSGVTAALAPYVIWNFVDATSIDTGTQVDGSVLAPLASLSNHTQINGSVAVASFNQGGEVHLGTFAGNSRLTRAISGAVPEPTTWAMMIGGVGIVGGALRRRRKAIRSGAATRTA